MIPIFIYFLKLFNETKIMENLSDMFSAGFLWSGEVVSKVLWELGIFY
jgi:hypothetical protein